MHRFQCPPWQGGSRPDSDGPDGTCPCVRPDGRADQGGSPQWQNGQQSRGPKWFSGKPVIIWAFKCPLISGWNHPTSTRVFWGHFFWWNNSIFITGRGLPCTLLREIPFSTEPWLWKGENLMVVSNSFFLECFDLVEFKPATYVLCEGKRKNIHSINKRTASSEGNPVLKESCPWLRWNHPIGNNLYHLYTAYWRTRKLHWTKGFTPFKAAAFLALRTASLINFSTRIRGLLRIDERFSQFLHGDSGDASISPKKFRGGNCKNCSNPEPKKKIKKNYFCKVGPLPVISRVVSPFIGVITLVTHL